MSRKVVDKTLEALIELRCWVSDGSGKTPSQKGAKCATLNQALNMVDDAIQREKFKRDPRLIHTVPDVKVPICEECDEEMHRYGPALDTGKMGWSCDQCGWSQDDDE